MPGGLKTPALSITYDTSRIGLIKIRLLTLDICQCLNGSDNHTIKSFWIGLKHDLLQWIT